jgi:hypothetical protein
MRNRWFQSLFLLVLGTATLRAAHPLDQWEWVTPRPQGNDLLSVRFLNHQFVTVGRAGTVLSSIDGTTWQPRGKVALWELRGVEFGNGRYVAVGELGVLAHSTDLDNWTVLPVATLNHFSSVVFATGHFVAVTEGGEIFRSANGLDWTRVFWSPGQVFRSIRHLAGQFWVVGHRQPQQNVAPQELVLFSADGATWQLESTNEQTLFNDIASDGVRLVATPAGSAFVHVRGADMMWRRYFAVFQQMGRILFHNGAFIRWHSSSSPTGTTAAEFWRSTDGAFWTSHALPAPFSAEDMCVGNNRFVVVGRSGRIAWSDNGTNFTAVSTNTLNAGWHWLNSSAVAFGRLVVGGASFEDGRTLGFLASSANLTDWQTNLFNFPGGAQPISSFASGGGRLLALANWSGVLFVSEDAIQWTQVTLPNSLSLQSLAYAGDRWVGVQEHGLPPKLVISTNGTDWQTHLLAGPNPPNIQQVYAAAGRFWGWTNYYLSPPSSDPYWSTDGTNWTKVTAPLPLTVIRVVGTEDRLLVYDDTRSKMASTIDGTSWTVQDADFGGRLTPLQVASSQDGARWTIHQTGHTLWPVGLHYLDGHYYLVDSRAPGILRSGPAVHLSLNLASHPRLQISGPRARWYRILVNDSLTDGEWRQVSRMRASESSFNFEDNASSPAAARFYRIELEPEE